MLDTELSRLCRGSLLHSHSLAGFAFSTNNLGCALIWGTYFKIRICGKTVFHDMSQFHEIFCDVLHIFSKR